MALSSMTGFARADGTAGSARFVWEVRSVNAKGLDVRFRLPPGHESLEPLLRPEVAARLTRGSVSASLTLTREGSTPVVRLNEAALEAVLAAARSVGERIEVEPPRLDGLLAVKGVLEIVDEAETEEGRKAAEAAIVAGFARALDQLADSRRSEGAALSRILGERLDVLRELAAAAEACPSRQPEAMKARLADQVRALLDTDSKFDPDRLHQEAVLLAVKADVREEVDRLKAHVEQARALVAEGGTVGRRLDFLAQELGRESNTLCAKSNDLALTAIGLDMKATVEQFREQVQNVE